MKREKKNTVLNPPNLLSILRILLIPVFLLLMAKRKVPEAFVVFLLAGFTDVLDGFIARVWNMKTKIGAFLDPAADKLLMTASFIILTIPSLNSPNVIPLWLTVTVIGRDLLIVSAAFILYLIRGQKRFLPTLLGKSCTVLQVMVILIVLFLNTRQITFPLLIWLYLLTLLLTVLSAVDYSFVGIRMLSRPKEA